MDWKTFLSIIHSMLTIGEAESAAYLLRKDDRGLYTLYGQPVFISPSLDDIGVLKVPFLYGDWSRFIIRHVNGWVTAPNRDSHETITASLLPLGVSHAHFAS